MTLPLPRTYAPMEALLVDELPTGDEWQYEPKWDGFRCLAFRDGDTVDVMSKAGKPLTRYFPELVAMLRQVRAKRFVLDGEIVVPKDGELSFDELLLRIHPAASRITLLSTESPASLIVFDLLVDYNQNAWGRTLASIYSPRPTPRATVSTPVTWDEIEDGVEIEDFHIGNVPARFRERGDLWKPLLAARGRFDLERVL